MSLDHDFARLVETCIAAQAAVERSGTPAMKTLARILLFQIGQELARQELARQELARQERAPQAFAGPDVEPAKAKR